MFTVPQCTGYTTRPPLPDLLYYFICAGVTRSVAATWRSHATQNGCLHRHTTTYIAYCSIIRDRATHYVLIVPFLSLHHLPPPFSPPPGWYTPQYLYIFRGGLASDKSNFLRAMMGGGEGGIVEMFGLQLILFP